MNTRLVALGAVAAVLGAYLAVQELDLFSGGSSTAPAPGAATQTAAAANLNPLDGLDPESFTDIVEKPLFNPSRQPRPEEPVAPPPPPEQPVVEQPPPPPPMPQGPSPEDYKLLGVASGPDGRIAALRVASNGLVVYLRKGENVDSWSVIDVGDRSVAIGTPDNPVTYSLFDSGPGDGAAPEGAAPAAPVPAQPRPLPLPLPLPMPKQAQPPGQPGLPEQHSLPPDTGG